jgi:DNA-binding transcriptional regulator LsrR (DeoR family)
MRQPEIAATLHVSQARVSRMLKEAVELRIVRTAVVPPPGVHTDLEVELRDRYGMVDVVVADAFDEDNVLSAIGAAGAVYLETTLGGGDRVGISSWSSTVLAAVDAMAPRTVRPVDAVVQVLGGVGLPAVQAKATHLAEELGRFTGVGPTLFPAPGIVSSVSGRRALMADPYIGDVVSLWPTLTVLLAGIGSLQPSQLLRESGNAVSTDDQETLRAAGAVGDVCLRFFDDDGRLVNTTVNDRVLGIGAPELRAIPRRVGFAGGSHKHRAIRAAVRGGWVNVLITDVHTARFLADGD